jgi:hypothetical protein
MFVDRSIFHWHGDLSKLSDEQLAVLADYFLRPFVGDDPTTLAEARKELEAGTVVIEVISSPVETQST